MTDYRKDFPLLSEIGENTVDGREGITPILIGP